MSFFVERHHCPACESKEHTTIYSCSFLQPPIQSYVESFYGSQGIVIDFEYLKEAMYTLEKCFKCGLVYQKEIPNDFLMQKLYGEWLSIKKDSNQQVEEIALDSLIDYFREMMIFLRYFDTDPRKLNFLDVGMGWGRWCLIAKAFGVNTYGIELSKPKIEFGRSHGINMTSWTELATNSFDFINTEQFFEHVDKPLELLRQLKKALKLNGLIKISVPNGEDITRRLNVSDWTAPKYSKNSLNVVSPLEHINCYNHSSIIKMANIVGLHEVKMPLYYQYIYSTNWRSPQKIFKNLIKPIYFNVFNKGTYLFFRKGTGSQSL